MFVIYIYINLYMNKIYYLFVVVTGVSGVGKSAIIKSLITSAFKQDTIIPIIMNFSA